MPKSAWLLAVSAGLLTLSVLVGLRVWRGQRQARFRALAAELGLTWVVADDVALRRRLTGFELFAPVAASRADGLLTGSYHGIAVNVLNYDYGNFISSGFSPYIVVIFQTDHALPEFDLRLRCSLNTPFLVARDQKRGINSLPSVAGAAATLADFPELDAYILTGCPGRAVLERCAQAAAQQRWPAAACQNGTLIYYEPMRTRPTPAALRAILDAGEGVYRALLAVETG
jgi:hypothetical protein